MRTYDELRTGDYLLIGLKKFDGLDSLVLLGVIGIEFSQPFPQILATLLVFDDLLLNDCNCTWKLGQ